MECPCSHLSYQVMQEQYDDLLVKLDSQLDSFGRRLEKERSSFFPTLPTRSGSRLQSQHSKLSRATTKEVDPFSPGITIGLPPSPRPSPSMLSVPKLGAVSFVQANEGKMTNERSDPKSEALQKKLVTAVKAMP